MHEIKNRIIHELIKISLHNSKSYRRFEGEREREKDGNPFYLGCHRLYLFLSPRWTRPAGHFQAGEKLQRFVPYEKYGNARGLILDTSFSLSFPPSGWASVSSRFLGASTNLMEPVIWKVTQSSVYINTNFFFLSFFLTIVVGFYLIISFEKNEKRIDLIWTLDRRRQMRKIKEDKLCEVKFISSYATFWSKNKIK